MLPFVEGSGRPWSDEDESDLAALMLEGTPASEIARRLGRSVPAVQGKARMLRHRWEGTASPYAVPRPDVLGAAAAAAIPSCGPDDTAHTAPARLRYERPVERVRLGVMEGEHA
jgi:hypothetical protein